MPTTSPAAQTANAAVPSELDGDERRRELRGGRADVDRHVVHRERAVDLRGVALVELGDHVGGVRLEDASADGHEAQRGEEKPGMVRNREPDVSEGEDQRAEDHRAAAPQELVADPAAHRGNGVGERRERAEREVGAVVGVAELLHHEEHDHGRHAVVAEPLPQLDEEEGRESLRPRRRLRLCRHVRFLRSVDCRRPGESRPSLSAADHRRTTMLHTISSPGVRRACL